MKNDNRLKVDIWSDYVCPFCYLQLPVLEQLQEAYRGRIEVQWHAFELRPEPIAMLDPNAEYLRSTWSRTVFPMAQQRNMVLKMPPVQPRSRKALEAAAFAASLGRFDVFHKQAFRAFFEHGRDIGHPPTLAALADESGLDAQALLEALSSNQYTGQVLADEELADQLGLRAIPAVLVRRADQPLNEAMIINGTLALEQLCQRINSSYRQ